MGIQIGAKTDYSFLFSSMNSGKSSQQSMDLTGLLTDYKSIKSGSYGKLMKAYFTEGDNSRVSKLANSRMEQFVSKEDAKKLNQVQTASDSLKEAADALLFPKKDADKDGTAEQDKDAIYSAVNKFVTNYNSLLSAVDAADNATVSNRLTSMTNQTDIYSKALGRVGITIKEDGMLSLDKDTFMQADASHVKSLFRGNGSFAYQTSAQASMLNYSASKEASKAAIYTGNGNYSSVLNNGNLYNGFF